MPNNVHFLHLLDSQTVHVVDQHIQRIDQFLSMTPMYSPTFVNVEPFRIDQLHQHADKLSLKLETANGFINIKSQTNIKNVVRFD